MSSKDTILPAVQGSHTVFLVTNFWESMDASVEIAQGKAVTDAAKEAGVQHIIFSSLVNTKEATEGRLTHISHFDGKADIEQYIRDSGVPATFVLMGIFMSGFESTIRKDQDGEGYTLALPVGGDSAKIPLVDPTSETGLFTATVLRKFPDWNGKRVLAASGWYTPNQLINEFSEAIGKPAKYQQIPGEVFKSFMPPPVAQELLENFLLLDDKVGYYNNGNLDEWLSLVDGKPKSWKEYVAENKAKWL